MRGVFIIGLSDLFKGAIDFYDMMMRYPDSLYTRQQLGELTSLSDDLLSFWIRQGLLIATEGGRGRGSHRKFDIFQVSIAAVLAELRRYGVNIGMLRQLADVLQRGTALARSAECNFWGLYEAARLGSRLCRFREGHPVIVDNPNPLPDPGHFATRNAYDAYARSLYMEATSEDEIIREAGKNEDLRDAFAPILALARSLGPNDSLALDLFMDLNHRAFRYVWDENKISDWGDSEWVVVATGDDHLDIYRAIKGNDPMEYAGDEIRSGLYLAPGAIFHSVWGDRLQPLLIYEPPQSEERKAARVHAQAMYEQSRARLEKLQ